MSTHDPDHYGVRIGPATVRVRRVDGYFDATAICKTYGTRWRDFARTNRAQAAITRIAERNGIPELATISADDATEAQKCASVAGTEAQKCASVVGSCEGTPAGNSRGAKQGTWIHPDLVLALVDWCVPGTMIDAAGWLRQLWLEQAAAVVPVLIIPSAPLPADPTDYRGGARAVAIARQDLPPGQCRGRGRDLVAVPPGVTFALSPSRCRPGRRSPPRRDGVHAVDPPVLGSVVEDADQGGSRELDVDTRNTAEGREQQHCDRRRAAAGTGATAVPGQPGRGAGATGVGRHPRRASSTVHCTSRPAGRLLQYSKTWNHASDYLGVRIGPATVRVRRADGYFDATGICKAYGTRWPDFRRTSRAKAAITRIAERNGIPETATISADDATVVQKCTTVDATVVQKCTAVVETCWGTSAGNSRGAGQGAWIHPDLVHELVGPVGGR